MPNKNEIENKLQKQPQTLQTRSHNELALPNQRGYSDYVQEVIEAFFLDSLRAPLDPETLIKTVASWEVQFREVDIPASKLMKLYRMTMQKNPKFFTVGSILETWEDYRQSSLAVDTTVCVICNGTKKAMKMDMTTGEDVELDCHCTKFVGK